MQKVLLLAILLTALTLLLIVELQKAADYEWALNHCENLKYSEAMAIEVDVTSCVESLLENIDLPPNEFNELYK